MIAFITADEEDSDESARPLSLLGRIVSDLSGTKVEGRDQSCVSCHEICLHALVDKIHDIASRIHQPALFDVALQLLQIMESCITLLMEITTCMLTAENSSDRVVASLEATKSSMSELVVTVCERILSKDWSDIVIKRKFSAKDLGFVLRLQLQHLDHVKRTEKYNSFANDIIAEVINSTEGDSQHHSSSPTTAKDTACTNSVKYPNINAQTILIPYNVIMKDLYSLWSILMTEKKDGKYDDNTDEFTSLLANIVK